MGIGDVGDQTTERLVQPFYLEMMRTNALDHCADLHDDLVAVGRSTTSQEVISLLQDHWRPTVMGAWFALFHDDKAVRTAVIAALSVSLGSLDSPPLTTVATLLSGDEAIPAFEEYCERDAAHEFGACRYTAAAIEHLGATPSLCPPTDRDRSDLNGMLAVATELRDAR